MRVVCDASAIFSGIVGEENFTTSLVVAEVRDFNSRDFLEQLILSKKLFVSDPRPNFVEIVREASSRTGDELSNADVSVIALALELNATVVSNDYGIQNVCAFLGMKYEHTDGFMIHEVKGWMFQCEGCGKVFQEREKTCDFCGNRVRKRVRSDFP